MQGMIHHHQQAVDMTAMIAERTENRNLRLIGERISKSQSDEINFMKRWLDVRGEAVEHRMPAKSTAHDHAAHGQEQTDGGGSPKEQLMPGMLTAKQMDALRKARGAEFDRLFVSGMIQHHNGALVMVKELFDTPGAAQDPELFSFATDVDTGQRAEIRSLQTLLEKNP